MNNTLSSVNLLFFLLLLSYSKTELLFSQQNKDSVNIWIREAKNTQLDKTKRITQLGKAYYYTIQSPEDSLKGDRLIEIAYRYYKLNDSINFIKINKQSERIIKKIRNDYLYGQLHWNYAIYYKRNSKSIKAYTHYNNACGYFEKAKDKENMAIMLQSMAQIKGSYKDYAGSEQLDIQAIKLFKELNNNFKLYALNNHLGLLQHDIKEYDKAIEYYHKALSYYKKISKKVLRKKHIEIYNNIANVYLAKREYINALSHYNKEFQNKNLRKDQYARILENRAYCRFKMKDTIGVLKDLKYSGVFWDSIKLNSGIVLSKIRLSDYYCYSRDSMKALQLIKEANVLARKIKNGRDYLSTLQKLSILDKKNSKKYLDRYIEFNDSLVSAERRMRNKFTRIEFETDEYIEETERLSQQRIWIIVTSIGGILILSLLYFLRVQKVNNEKLRIEAEHQKANEEVYVLTLQQQARVEEERIKERNRISEELHDGILGKLFGTRFGLGFLPLEGDEDTLEKHQSLLDELQDIEKEIRDVSHKLSDNFNNTDINFTSIIKQLLEDKSIIGKFTHSIQFSQDISWKKVDEISKANIYRIIQEALQNIIKHAKANHVSLNFELINNQLVTTIKDDGIGFDTKKGKRGIGIKNIKSRIGKLKGSIKIESEINVGTTLQINTPYIKKDGQ